MNQNIIRLIQIVYVYSYFLSNPELIRLSCQINSHVITLCSTMWLCTLCKNIDLRKVVRKRVPQVGPHKIIYHILVKEKCKLRGILLWLSSQVTLFHKVAHFVSILWGLLRGAMKQGRGTCSMLQSFLVILPNVPSKYYVHRDIWPQLWSVWYVHVP